MLLQEFCKTETLREEGRVRTDNFVEEIVKNALLNFVWNGLHVICYVIFCHINLTALTYLTLQDKHNIHNTL